MFPANEMKTHGSIASYGEANPSKSVRRPYIKKHAFASVLPRGLLTSLSRAPECVAVSRQGNHWTLRVHAAPNREEVAQLGGAPPCRESRASPDAFGSLDARVRGGPPTQTSRCAASAFSNTPFATARATSAFAHTGNPAPTMFAFAPSAIAPRDTASMATTWDSSVPTPASMVAAPAPAAPTAAIAASRAGTGQGFAFAATATHR